MRFIKNSSYLYRHDSSISTLTQKFHVSSGLRHLSSPSKTKNNSSEAKFTLDSLTSYISSIRLKVASSLTSSLPPSDRVHLLKSLGIDIREGDSFTPAAVEQVEEDRRTSIGEAVAQAVAKEASTENLLEEERKEIWRKAEKAAMERVQSDFLIKERQLALERWKKELEEEKRLEEKGNDPHPILGPVLIDLGYKRIHVAKAEALASVPVWEKQRVYRHDRAKNMASDKMKTTDLGLPGIITLHESEDGQLAILDGQHRVGMMTILQERQHINENKIDLDRVLIEVFPQLHNFSPKHAQDIFTEINKAEPVKLLDMPGVAKVSERRIINEAAMSLQDAYPDMFKPSQRCRAPNVNIDNLRDAIFASGLLKRHSIKNRKSLVEWVLQKNRELAAKYINDDGARQSHSDRVMNKAHKYEFYLGLDLGWLYD